MVFSDPFITPAARTERKASLKVIDGLGYKILMSCLTSGKLHLQYYCCQQASKCTGKTQTNKKTHLAH